MKQELIRPIVKVGNSAGVLLPREWLNGRARIELVKKPLNIKKDVLEILDSYLEDIIGIYLVGSYARGEQTDRSDVDILVVSKNINKLIVSGKYEIIIAPLKSIVSTLKNHPERIYSKIIDAKAIFNKGLLGEFQEIKLNKNSFKNYFSDTKRIIKMDRELIKMDKLEGDMLKSVTVVYSSILRLRALYMIKSILYKKNYTNKNFEKWIVGELGINKEDYEDLYGVYRGVVKNKKTKETISISLVENLVNFLEKEANICGKKKK